MRATVYNTVPRKKGTPDYVPEDFLPKDKKEGEVMTNEEREQRMIDSIENSKRFEKGVVYSNG